jgi:peptidoglycan/xylan/chitin deacetylase (PgdA/CDA1 family)
MLNILLVALAIAAIAGLAYLFCYGGYEGPIDWVMHTDSHGTRDRARIALTFDDGPDRVHTPALLDTLAAFDVKATFFVCGGAADANPDVCARIARDGHELGNHTYTHRYLPLARKRSVARELELTDAAIERAAGVVPKLARPPWGGRRPSTVRAFRRAAKRVVLWDVNSYDWKGAPPEDVARRVLERVRPGSIVLLHDARDGGERTIAAVRMLVPALRARGYELVTASAALAA